MLDAAREARGFVAGRIRGDLDTGTMLRFALERAIEVIGEAANQVTDETRDQAPSIPSALIVKMRHRLVHAYFDIRRDRLWTTATENLPTLISELEELIPLDWATVLAAVLPFRKVLPPLLSNHPPSSLPRPFQVITDAHPHSLQRGRD